MGVAATLPELSEWTLLSSIEIQCHKRFHLKPKTAFNYTEISSLSVTDTNIMGGNMVED